MIERATLTHNITFESTNQLGHYLLGKKIRVFTLASFGVSPMFSCGSTIEYGDYSRTALSVVVYSNMGSRLLAALGFHAPYLT
jgi:hypothetical protein